MSTAFFCSSLPARPFGHKNGRGTTDTVRTPDIVRLAANPSAQACRLKRWNICHSSKPTAKSSPAPSPTKFEVEIEKDFEPFVIVHKKKAGSGPFDNIERLGRFNGVDPPYIKPSTVFSEKSLVITKDVVIDPVTELTVRIYLPYVDVDSPPGKLPVLVYFHGGAFMVEDIASPPYHNYTQKLAEKANILIVSVNYRLAPEKFLPVAYDDCKAALKWVTEQTDATKHEPWIANHGDKDRLFLSGDSAGGNITHNIAIDPDTTPNIEGIALIHPYFFGKEALETELRDPANLLLHRKLWSFISPDSKEGLDDPQENPLSPTAPSLKNVKGRRAVVFVAGKDFHSERAKLYNDELTKELKGKVWQICNHDGVGHVYHLSADAKVEKIESVAAGKMMTDLLTFYKENKVVLGTDVETTLKTKTKEAIDKMKDTERAMADKMMKQLVAFFQGDKEKLEALNKSHV